MPDSTLLDIDASRCAWHAVQERPSCSTKLSAFGPRTFWLTGLSGSGKSTLAAELGRVLGDLQVRYHVLDGDVLRRGLCSDLGFSEVDRAENIRRIAEIAKLFNDAGLHAIVSVISPHRRDREIARRIIQGEKFLEIYIDTSLATCMDRDPKGLYARASSGEIKNFTGVSAPYDPPENPALVVKTEKYSIPEAKGILKQFVLFCAADRPDIAS